MDTLLPLQHAALHDDLVAARVQARARVGRAVVVQRAAEVHEVVVVLVLTRAAGDLAHLARDQVEGELEAHHLGLVEEGPHDGRAQSGDECCHAEEEDDSDAEAPPLAHGRLRPVERALHGGRCPALLGNAAARPSRSLYGVGATQEMSRPQPTPYKSARLVEVQS